MPIIPTTKKGLLVSLNFRAARRWILSCNSVFRLCIKKGKEPIKKSYSSGFIIIYTMSAASGVLICFAIG